jgi:damage-control phosphatase, subfamily I
VKTYLDCIPCFFRQALAAARMSSTDKIIQRHVLNSVALMIPDLALNATPPEIAQQVYRVVYEITGNKDPYHEAKKLANESAMSCYSRMKDIVDYSNESLQTACKLAIAGNEIDLGAKVDFGSMESLVEDSLAFELDKGKYAEFKKSIENAFLILYIGDNAGETVFDRILIEQILQMNQSEIVFVVRENPIINDATFADAIKAGLNNVATIISNGSDAPATILSQCSPEMLNLYHAADVIISKGQGNYESLSGMPENIFFLLKVKCPVIARDSGFDVGSFILTSLNR